MIAWKSFNSRPVYIAIIVIVAILSWDFYSRVWYPLDADLAADAQSADGTEFTRFQFSSMPQYLSEWINEATREAAAQEQVAAQESEEDAERRREAERERQLRPLDGSTELENIRLRVRAIFKHMDENGRMQSLALAEQQEVETGEVSRVLLRAGEERGGYRIEEITADAVHLTHSERNGIRLRVFEFN